MKLQKEQEEKVMKLKKLTALLLAGIMTLSLAACGGGSSESGSASSGESSGSTGGSSSESTGDASGAESSGELSGKLTVWTLAADLEQFADKFKEENPVWRWKL